MCGIAGIIDFKNKKADKDLVEKMVSIQKHRGPDDEGLYTGDHIALGHCRLAIIDLSSNAHQPMSNEDGTKWIIYNGEVYNYIELREELVKKGHVFKSQSDTEVVLHAFEEWGEGALNRFNGMWAFAIWDTQKQELFVSRDRFGIKPFYFYHDKNVFIFASEIKALLLDKRISRQPNDQAIYEYLISGYGYMDMAEYTFFKDIYKIKPGHYVRLNLLKDYCKCKEYWDIPKHTRFGRGKDIVKTFYGLLEDAVRLRLRSDVNVGIALSGGLDSSSIACIADKIHKGGDLFSFSSYYETEGVNEKGFIEEVLRDSHFTPSFISAMPTNLLSDLENIIWHQEEPYSTLSILPQWYVMKASEEKGVKVLLTGQAGDETLAGYDKYYLYLFADLFKRFKWKAARKEIELYNVYQLATKGAKEDVSRDVSKILLSYFLPGFMKTGIQYFMAREEPSPYLNKDFTRQYSSDVEIKKRFSSILNNELYNAFKISPLPSLLHIDDRASMAHSVETRNPFLDYRLVEYLFSVPAEWKIRDSKTKFLLREAMKGVLPEMIRIRRDKMGFPTPLKSWIKNELKDDLLKIFSSKEFLSRPYFNAAEIKKDFSRLIEQGKMSEYTVWSWLNLELWFRRYID